MSDKKNSFSYAIRICLLVSVVCGVAVSSAAVILRPIQEENRRIAIQRNVLEVLGEYEPGDDISAKFESLLEPMVVELDTGNIMADMEPSIDVGEMLKSNETSMALSKEQDIAQISRRQNYDVVYVAKNQTNDSIEAIVIPISGYALWSTVYGFLALEPDFNTIRGITFYEHGETPGLGGEIDNPNWKAQWKGKKIFDENGMINFAVLKNGLAQGNPNAVDSISGATLTSNGIANSINFWFGENGYARFLDNIKESL